MNTWIPKHEFFLQNRVSRLWFLESFNSRILGSSSPGSLRNTCSSNLTLLGTDSKHSANKVQECTGLHRGGTRERGIFCSLFNGDDRFTRFQAYRVFSGDATMARYAERRRNKRAQMEGGRESKRGRCCSRCTELPSDSKSAVASSVFHHPSYFFPWSRSGCLRTHPTIVLVSPFRAHSCSNCCLRALSLAVQTRRIRGLNEFPWISTRMCKLCVFNSPFI